MPDFWEFPTVSMGLGPIMAIYQARFNRYLENRGLKPATDAKVWAFLGDGETDEPESLGAITLASREKLDNLIFVINCNLQRLDGPVRGNGKIIQELEAAFRGAGWNVIKVLWGTDWDRASRARHRRPARQAHGRNGRRRIPEAASSNPAPTSASISSASIRACFKLVEHYSDEELRTPAPGRPRSAQGLRRLQSGRRAQGQPTVILARTIKGYGLGEAGEGKNVTHQQKKLNEDELREFPHALRHSPQRRPNCRTSPFYRPPDDSPEDLSISTRAARNSAATCRPRSVRRSRSSPTTTRLFKEFRTGSDGREVSTTMAFVGMLRKMLQRSGNRQAHRADRSRRSAHLRHGVAVPDQSAFTPASASSTSPSTSTRCSTTTKRKTARFSKKASPKPARWRRSSPPALPMPRTASTRFRSSFTTRCSASSASAT